MSQYGYLLVKNAKHLLPRFYRSAFVRLTKSPPSVGPVLCLYMVGPLLHKHVPFVFLVGWATVSVGFPTATAGSVYSPTAATE